MAIVNAVASGNYSNYAVTFGGITPQPGDTVRCGAFTVDLDINVSSVEFEQNGTGQFRVRQIEIDAAGGLINLTGCDFVKNIANYNICLSIQHSSGSLSFRNLIFKNGTAGGSFCQFSGSGTVNFAENDWQSTTDSFSALLFSGSGIVNCQTARGGPGQVQYGINKTGSGTLNVTNAYPGSMLSGSPARGVVHSSGTTNVVNCYGGSQVGSANNVAVAFIGNGVINITNAYGGDLSSSPGVLHTGTGDLYVDNAFGNNYGFGGGAVLSYAISSLTTGGKTYIKKAYSGPYGASPFNGAVLLFAAADNVFQFRESPNGPTKTLIDASINGDVPAESDVRALVVFNNGDNVGTCAVPLPGQTSLGVPVDDTVGTAVLTSDAIGQQDHRVYDDVEGSIGWILRRMQAGTSPGLPRAF